MYDDAWYNAFVPGARTRTGVTTGIPYEQIPSQRRRASLLAQSNGFPSTDVDDDLNGFERPGPARLHRTTADTTIATARRRSTSCEGMHNGTKPKKRSEDPHEAHRHGHRRRASVGRRHPWQGNELGFDHWMRQHVSGNRSPPARPTLDAKHEKYLLQREKLRLSRSHLDNIISDTTSNLDLLASLSTSFDLVERQTTAFRSRCDALVAEQDRLIGLTDRVTLNLQYYNYLDPITRRLNAPGSGHLVKGADFPEMLANLDRCIDYMESHPTQKESETYRARYRLLLTRALTLVRVHFTNTLREIAADVAARIADRQLNDTTMPALLYAKFRVGAPELKTLGLEIQRRALPPIDAEPGTQGEYQSLVNELYQSYSAARGRLIVPIIRRKMAELAVVPSAVTDIVTFARSTIGYMRGVCVDECELWHEWFEGDGGLYDFLQSMCEPLYDYLRPRIIKETQLARLCEMCSLIQGQYMNGADGEDDEVGSSISAASESLDFASLIRSALQDAQTRLVFLAMSFLRNEIELFKPKASDMDGVISVGSKADAAGSGPALSGTRVQKAKLGGGSATPTAAGGVRDGAGIVVDGSDASKDVGWDLESSKTYDQWYPTLRKAIWLLSRIYRLVNSTVFDDLAHQIVHHTTVSLQGAANQILGRQTQGTFGRTMAQLFLLKQLLILKAQIVAFDIAFVTPELNLDFSSVTSTFWELRERGGLFNPRNLIKLVGGGLLPGVVENMLDAKAELDARLRAVINDFIEDQAVLCTRAVSIEEMQKPAFNAAEAASEIRSVLQQEVLRLREKLDACLDDSRTKETLIEAVRDQTLSHYEAFFERYTKTHSRTANRATVSVKGKGHEGEVWDPDTFADWLSNVFSLHALTYRSGEEDMDIPFDNEGEDDATSSMNSV